MTDDTNSAQPELCEHCGEVFSDFLREMAEHNEQVICPKCGQTHQRQSAE